MVHRSGVYSQRLDVSGGRIKQHQFTTIALPDRKLLLQANGNLATDFRNRLKEDAAGSRDGGTTIDLATRRYRANVQYTVGIDRRNDILAVRDDRSHAAFDR